MGGKSGGLLSTTAIAIWRTMTVLVPLCRRGEAFNPQESPLLYQDKGSSFFRLIETPGVLLSVVHKLLLWPDLSPTVWWAGSSYSSQSIVCVTSKQGRIDSQSTLRPEEDDKSCSDNSLSSWERMSQGAQDQRMHSRIHPQVFTLLLQVPAYPFIEACPASRNSTIEPSDIFFFWSPLHVKRFCLTLFWDLGPVWLAVSRTACVASHQGRAETPDNREGQWWLVSKESLTETEWSLSTEESSFCSPWKVLSSFPLVALEMDVPQHVEGLAIVGNVQHFPRVANWPTGSCLNEWSMYCSSKPFHPKDGIKLRGPYP